MLMISVDKPKICMARHQKTGYLAKLQQFRRAALLLRSELLAGQWHV